LKGDLKKGKVCNENIESNRSERASGGTKGEVEKTE